MTTVDPVECIKNDVLNSVFPLVSDQRNDVFVDSRSGKIKKLSGESVKVKLNEDELVSAERNSNANEAGNADIVNTKRPFHSVQDRIDYAQSNSKKRRDGTIMWKE